MRTLFGFVLDAAGLPPGALGRYAAAAVRWTVIAVAFFAPTFYFAAHVARAEGLVDRFLTPVLEDIVDMGTPSTTTVPAP